MRAASALIHAATMVTSGVVLLNRMHIVFEASPVASVVICAVGAFTALFAAIIAFGQTDIKKVLAYSTVSQLGFMFVACGAGAYWVGIFHVTTHAFFKALLFLGSGAVIHAMNHDDWLPCHFRCPIPVGLLFEREDYYFRFDRQLGNVKRDQLRAICRLD